MAPLVMLNMSRRAMWSVAETGATIAATMATRKLVERGWMNMTHRPPPTNPADPRVHWKEALLWTAASGALVGVARMLAQRAAASGWERAMGTPPPFR